MPLLWEEDAEQSLTNLSLYDLVDGLPEDYQDDEDDSLDNLISFISCSSIDCANLMQD